MIALRPQDLFNTLDVSIRSRLSSKSVSRRDEKSGGQWHFVGLPVRVVYVLPCVLAACCYVNSLDGQFVHDDIFAIQNNGDVTGQNPISDVFLNDFWGTRMDSVNSHKSYRPLCVLSFRLDFYLSGGDSRWFHVVNTALHVAVTFLLTHVSLHVLQTSLEVALMSSCFFAVHPIHTEAVAGVVGRADLMAALFFLLAFYTYSWCVHAAPAPTRDINGNKLSSTDKPWMTSSSRATLFLVTLLLSLAAMLCKETGVTVLGLCLIYDLHFCLKNGARGSWIRCACLIAAGAFLMLFRLWIMGFQEPTVFQSEANPASFSPSLLTRFLTFSYLPSFNLWLLLCPAQLSYDWTGSSIPLVTSVWDMRNMASLALYTGCLLLVSPYLWTYWTKITKPSSTVKAHGKPKIEHSELPLFALGIMVISFLPSSNLLFRVGFVVAERLLYIPSMGFCLLVSCGLHFLYTRMPQVKNSMMATFVLLLAVMAVRTYDRNKVWHSRESLFWSGVSTLSNNAKVHYNWANLLKDQRNWTGAEAHYRTAIELYPHVSSYYLNLGTVVTNKTEKHLCYQQALKLRPDHPGALVNLGSLLLDQGDRSGLNYVEKALAIDPHHIEALVTMSYTMLNQEQLDDAGRYSMQALSLRPDLASTHFCRAVYLHNSGNLTGAKTEYELTLTLDPHEKQAMINLGNILLQLGHYDQMENLLSRALVEDRGCSECYTQLGLLYTRQGQHKDAIVTLGRATALEPNNTFVMLKYVETLKNNGQREKAREELSNLMMRVTSDLRAVKFAFSFSMEEKRYEDAHYYIQEAVALAEQSGDSSLGGLYLDQGEVYRYRQDLPHALQYYEKAIKADRSLVSAYINAGSVHHIQKNYEMAESYYLQALEVDQNSRLAQDNLQRLRNIYPGSEKKGR